MLMNRLFLWLNTMVFSYKYISLVSLVFVLFTVNCLTGCQSQTGPIVQDPVAQGGSSTTGQASGVPGRKRANRKI